MLIYPEFAAHWASQLGCDIDSLQRLGGGINNLVYHCGHRERKWVIKGYQPNQGGKQDRMHAEVEFLEFAKQAAPGFTPELIYVDRDRRCVVMEHINGKKFPDGIKPSSAVIAEAVEFFRQLNSNSELARKVVHANAAEGFSSLSEHIDNINARIKGMTYTHLEQPFAKEAKVILEHLRAKEESVREETNESIDKALIDDTIKQNELCISPSDFGFHNAIRTTEKTIFIDFEFAGWDDPAKTILDFAYQPRIPLGTNESPLIQALDLDLRKNVVARSVYMRPIIELKWICIILTVLTPARLEQMLTMNPEEDRKSLIKKRLMAAIERLRMTSC